MLCCTAAGDWPVGSTSPGGKISQQVWFMSVLFILGLPLLHVLVLVLGACCGQVSRQTPEPCCWVSILTTPLAHNPFQPVNPGKPHSGLQGSFIFFFILLSGYPKINLTTQIKTGHTDNSLNNQYTTFIFL